MWTAIRLNLIQKLICIIAFLFLIFFIIFGFAARRALEKQVLFNIENSVGMLVANESREIVDHFQNLENLGRHSAIAIGSWLKVEPLPEKLENFDKKYRMIDGALRTDVRAFSGPDISAVFLSSRGQLTDELRNIILATEGCFDDYARGVKPFVFNMYLITRHQFIRIYEKDWALDIESDHDFTKDVFYYISNPDHNPDREPRWTAPYYDSIWKHWMTSLITPIYIGDRFLGIVGHDVILDHIYEEILDKKFFKSGYGFIFDRDENVVIHPHHLDRLMETAEMGTKLGFQDVGSRQFSRAITRLVKMDLDYDRVVHEQFNEGGSNYHLFASRLDFLNWYFAIVVPHSEVISMLGQFRKRFILGAILASAALFLVIILALWFYIVSPIRKLKKATQEIQAGQFGKRLEIDSHDEFGELSRSFNDMSEKLRQSLDELKLDIAERQKTEKALKQSEERVRAILNAARNASFIITDGRDPEPLVLEFSPGAESIFGYTREEMIGNPVSVLHLPEDVARFPEAHRTMREGKAGFRGETILVRKNGEQFPALFSTYPLYDDTGQMYAALGVSIDITAQKKSEEALRHEKEKFQILLDKSPFGVSLIQPSGVYEYVNPKFTAIFGYTLEDIPDGAAWFEKAFPDLAYRKEVYNMWLNDLKTHGAGESRPRIFSVSCKDGAERLIHFRPVLMENGFQFVIYDDITEKRRLEDQLHQVEKLESIGTLAGGIAHDFNNLLMGIQGRTSLMLVNTDPHDSNHDHLKEIEAYVQSAADLTKQLLGFARGGKYEVKPTNLNHLIQKTAEMFGRATKEISINERYQDEVWPCEVDRTQIEQVMFNLFVNARHAMPGGGQLYIETQNILLDEEQTAPFIGRPGKYVKITVRDTGVGMDEKIRERIFDPFFTTKEMGWGTGLGLASVYGIIKNHGGVIQVSSEEGEGASFFIYFPATDAVDVVESDTEPQTKWGDENILLIDDEEMIVEVGKEMLQTLGYRVMTASGGKEGLALYEANRDKIDLVILDMIMPNMSGSETFDRLMALNPEIKVLLSSGYSLDGQAAEILGRGCLGFIQKPFKLNQLSERLRKILD